MANWVLNSFRQKQASFLYDKALWEGSPLLPAPPTRMCHSPLPLGEQNPKPGQIHSAGWWPEAWEDIRLRTEGESVHLKDTAPSQLKNYLCSTKSMPVLFLTQNSWELPNVQVSELWDEKILPFLTCLLLFSIRCRIILLSCQPVSHNTHLLTFCLFPMLWGF